MRERREQKTSPLPCLLKEQYWKLPYSFFANKTTTLEFTNQKLYMEKKQGEKKAYMKLLPFSDQGDLHRAMSWTLYASLMWYSREFYI